MSFLDGYPRIATEKDVTANWYGGRRGANFRCALCGHKFTVGEYWRCVYTNGTPGAGGNPLVCIACDGTNEEVIAKWRAMIDEARTKYWFFTRCDCD